MSRLQRFRGPKLKIIVDRNSKSSSEETHGVQRQVHSKRCPFTFYTCALKLLLKPFCRCSEPFQICVNPPQTTENGGQERARQLENTEGQLNPVLATPAPERNSPSTSRTLLTCCSHSPAAAAHQPCHRFQPASTFHLLPNEILHIRGDGRAGRLF